MRLPKMSLQIPQTVAGISTFFTHVILARLLLFSDQPSLLALVIHMAKELAQRCTGKVTAKSALVDSVAMSLCCRTMICLETAVLASYCLDVFVIVSNVALQSLEIVRYASAEQTNFVHPQIVVQLGIVLFQTGTVAGVKDTEITCVAFFQVFGLDVHIQLVFRNVSGIVARVTHKL
jgi:hypothetical protein